MNIICFNTENHRVSSAAQAHVKATVPKTHYHICRSIDALELRLRTPFQRPAMAILSASSINEINQFINLKTLLADISLILITHDSEKETMSRGLKLYPRFIADRNIHPGNLTEVMTRMIGSLTKDCP